MHTHTYTLHAYTYMLAHRHVHMYTYTYVRHTCEHTHAGTQTCAHIYLYLFETHMLTHTYTYTCMPGLDTCIHTHTRHAHNTHMLSCMPMHSHTRHTLTCILYTRVHTHICMHACLHTHSHTHFFPPPALGPVALTCVPAVLERKQLGTKPSPGAAGWGRAQRSPVGCRCPGQQSPRVWLRWRTRSPALQPARLGRWLCS